MSQIRRDLADFSFINVDCEGLLSQALANFEDFLFQETGQMVTLGQADPLRILIYSGAYQQYLALKMAEHAAKQNLLAFASGDILDYRAANYGKYEIQRLPAQKAITTIRFTLSAVMSNKVHVPVGTKVTAGDNVFFSTTESLIIPAGSNFGEVSAQCSQAGEIGNGYDVGQINRLVDPLPYIAAVTNVDISQGGADMESDDSLRDRIYLAPEGFSTAGPDGAYIYHVKSFDSTIADVKVTTLAPGQVDVVVLLEGGKLPSATLLSELEKHLMDENIRPLTDKVNVLAPQIVPYQIKVEYYINAENAARENQIKAAVNEAVNSYILWQESVIGRDIIPSKIIEKIMNAGAKRAQVISPSFTHLSNIQVAQSNFVNIVYGGLEDD